MKTPGIALLFFPVALFTACKDHHVKTGNHFPQSVGDSPVRTAPAGRLKQVTPPFTDVDAGIKTELVRTLDNYLGLKNALADNNENSARSYGKAMVKALSAIDASRFTPEQKKIYEEDGTELTEDAEHIGNSKIAHQRMHFATLSQHLFNVLASFDIGKTLYVVYCDQASKDDLAMWLTENIDNKNPYLPDAKERCFSVREKIK
ncbi:MAG: hypothetical protein JWQ78_1480 [Sediminibacterium sp.]|nr:hypothetical protein [Sediminibacterium sp.]